ncbi:MAG TPA: tetratricopeptide repeat protein [archaeon]|nr:tetratricopeptide repeat protein [archaeon]
MKEQRKLAAIMFTDIVGYTALMSKDEQHAHEIIHKSRDILKGFIEQYNGEWLQAVGDATLSSFASVVDAVNCALEIQRTIRSEPELSLRIGIHIGDVVFEEGEVYGDGVNVASRLEQLAEPGGVCISGQVYRNIRNKPGIEAIFMGEKTLKNVDLPMKVYALTVVEQPAALPEPHVDKETEPAPAKRRSRRILIAVAGIIVVTLGLYAVYSRYLTVPTTVPGEKEIRSIAVLPFADMSAEKNQEYFCDGLAEELLNMLAKVKELRVKARTSSFSFKGEKVDIATIGEKLNVESVLEGSVRKSGDKVRITTQLIKVSDGYHLWSETYDRNLDDIFAVQEEISRQVVGALKITLLGEDASKLARQPTENIKAYDLYLVGRHHLNQGTVAAYEKAIDYFTQAIELDSNYALAYAGLAETYLFQYRNANLPKEEALSKAEEAARNALSLDDQLAEAHTALGHVKNRQQNLSGAEAELKKAIELNPNHMPAYRLYVNNLLDLGRYEDAQAILEKALEIDPLSKEIIDWLNLNLLMLGRFDESKTREYYGLYGRLEQALRKEKTRVELDPGNSRKHAILAWIYTGLGEYELAEKSLARARELAPEKIIIGEFGENYLYLAQKHFTRYMQFTYDILSKDPENWQLITKAAFAEMQVGNYEKALTLYERARSAYKQVGIPFGLIPWLIAAFGRADLVYMANAYFKTGDAESGEKLLAESRVFLEKLREQGLGTPASYYFEASVHALGGNKEMAFASLRKAIDLGWRLSWYARIDPTLESLRDTPEFKDMMAEVDADIARQRRQLKEEGLL